MLYGFLKFRVFEIITFMSEQIIKKKVILFKYCDPKNSFISVQVSDKKF